MRRHVGDLSAVLQPRTHSIMLGHGSVMPQHGSDATIWDAGRLRVATKAAGVALWSWNVDTDVIALDKRACRMWGVSDQVVTFEELSSHIHPRDLDRVKSAFQATRAILGAYDIEFRILDGDEVRWISARGQGDDDGIIGRIMFGVFLDITERKQGEEAREMLASEMSHRVKNLFALTSALTMIASRSTATKADMTQDLMHRLAALERAHNLVRPIPGQNEPGLVLLGDMLAVLLAPYTDGNVVGQRTRISVPEVRVGETAATALALVIHELATNSIKYGALSAPAGTLDIEQVAATGAAPWNNDELVVTWTERGGPSVAAHQGLEGFGSRLVESSMSGRLGGSIAFDWPAQGVIITLRMSKARLAI